MEKSEPTTNTASASPVVYYLQPRDASTDDKISMADLWRVVVLYKWLIIAITIATTAIAAAYAWSVPPVYRAEAILAPASSDQASRLTALAGDLGSIASMAGINIGAGGSTIDQSIAVLNSRAFTNALIRDEHLPIKEKIHTVTQDKMTGLVTLAVEWKDPQQAAQWANLIVERLNRHEQQAAISEAEKNLAYLKEQLGKTSALEMQQSIYRLIEAQTKNIMLAKARDEFAFKVIDPAVAPKTKTKPKTKLIVALGCLTGLAASILIACFISSIRKQASGKVLSP